MARSMRLEYPGAIYHVTVRGNERRAIYRDEGDYAHFLECLETCIQAFRVRLYLFCLMQNHFHLLVETPRANLGLFMHSLLTRYTVYFNRRYHRRGHLTQGRYSAKVVEGDGQGNKYLFALSRYIHLNPVFTRTTKSLAIADRIGLARNYRWSSYRGYIDERKRVKWVEYGPVLAQAAEENGVKTASYRRYVESGLAEEDEDMRKALWASARSIGGERFREWVEAKHNEMSRRAGSKEDVSFRRVEYGLSLEEVLKAVERFCGVKRDEILRRQRRTNVRGLAARWLCRYAGLTQRKAARVLGLNTGAAVSLQLRNLSRQIAGEAAFRERIIVAEKRLDRKAGEA